MRNEIEPAGGSRTALARSVVTSTVGFVSEVIAVLPGFAADKAQRNAWEALCAHRARRTEWEDARRWLDQHGAPRRSA